MITDLQLRTCERVQPINITAQVAKAVEGAGVADGVAYISTPHTTAAIYCNEDEENLLEDVCALVEALLSGHGPFKHDRLDDNARAHLVATLIGSATAVPVRQGRLDLGTWQSIFFLELDGPRTRRVVVALLADN